MTRQAIINRTVKVINTLPDDKVEEVSNFVNFIIKRYEETQLALDIQNLATQSQTFDFLKDEEELYTEKDLKKVYNGKR